MDVFNLREAQWSQHLKHLLAQIGLRLAREQVAIGSFLRRRRRRPPNCDPAVIALKTRIGLLAFTCRIKTAQLVALLPLKVFPSPIVIQNALDGKCGRHVAQICISHPMVFAKKLVVLKTFSALGNRLTLAQCLVYCCTK